jgi:hypothetical protein
LGRSSLVALAGVTAALGVAFVVTLGIHRFVVDIGDVKQAFDLGQERNLPTWWNTALLLGIVAVLLLAARLHDGRHLPTRRSLLVAALAVAYLSADEAAQLHEQFGAPTESWLEQRGIDLPTYTWLVPGAAIALVGVVLFVRWCRTLPPAVRSPCALGLGLYGAGALGAEGINGWLRKRDAEYPYVAGTLVEEWLEMGGCIVALHGVSLLLVVVDGPAEARTVRWAAQPAITPTSARLTGAPRTPGTTA